MKSGHLAMGALALTCAAMSMIRVTADSSKTAAPDDPHGFIDADLGDSALEGRHGGPSSGGIGPDVIVGDIFDLRNYTPNAAIDGYRSFIAGTRSCNIGTENLNWIADTNQHPVIAQQLYRLKNGRFEQVGQSWLKHGFFALWESLCDECAASMQTCQGKCLAVGCSDPYWGSLNGDNSGQGLGPKSEVNPVTGDFRFPHGRTSCGITPLCGRLLVRESDIDRHALGTGALYFLEAQYVSPDDALAGNANNNASYRQVWFNMQYQMTVNNLGGPGWSTTRQMVPAITAWAELDPTVHLHAVDIKGDGRVYVGSKVTDNGDGTWTYEYAVHNLNSHRAVSMFRLPVSAGVEVMNIGFHDVDYHSGEVIDPTDWPSRRYHNVLEWATRPFESDFNANAIRWGTLYNFRFTADMPPIAGSVTLGLFRPPTPASPHASVKVPAVVPKPRPESAPCIADIVGNDFAPPGDGNINSADLAILLGEWGASDDSPADLVSNITFLPPGDGRVDSADLAFMLGAWGPCE